MIILGIDPGTATTGYGIIKKHGNRITPIDFGCITTPKEHQPAERLESIFEAIKMLILSEPKPEVLVIEQLFFNANVRTAIAVGEARGVIMLAASIAGLKIVEYSPLQVKMTLAGYGRAKKDQIQFMVKTLLCLKDVPKPDDVADALALAITYAHTSDVSDKAKALL